MNVQCFDGVVPGLTARNKTHLVCGNQRWNEWEKAIRQNFGKELGIHVEERNGAVVRDSGVIFPFFR